MSEGVSLPKRFAISCTFNITRFCSFFDQILIQYMALFCLFLTLCRIVIKDLLSWDLMYLYPGFICCRRCFFDNWCICTALIFIVTDAFFETDVSATYFSLNLQILFSLPVMHNCIYILPFLELEDTSFANFSSASHVFYDLQMLLIKILHLQSPKIHYRRYLH